MILIHDHVHCTQQRTKVRAIGMNFKYNNCKTTGHDSNNIKISEYKQLRIMK